MPTRLSVLILLLASACRPPAYVQPTELEPHAILKVRHVVHQRRGPQYDSTIRLGRWSIDERTLDTAPGSEGIVHVRVRPEAAPLRVGGVSYHYEQRMVTRYRTVNENYTCYRYTCSGYGSSQRCGNQSSTCTRSRRESYQQLETVRVIDDQCAADSYLTPHVGGVYLVQFDYLGENQCNIQCFEQLPSADGQFTLQPCPPPPAPAATSGGRR